LDNTYLRGQFTDGTQKLQPSRGKRKKVVGRTDVQKVKRLERKKKTEKVGRKVTRLVIMFIQCPNGAGILVGRGGGYSGSGII